jgi:hypothetical protein
MKRIHLLKRLLEVENEKDILINWYPEDLERFKYVDSKITITVKWSNDYYD